CTPRKSPPDSRPFIAYVLDESGFQRVSMEEPPIQTFPRASQSRGPLSRGGTPSDLPWQRSFVPTTSQREPLSSSRFDRESQMVPLRSSWMSLITPIASG